MSTNVKMGGWMSDEGKKNLSENDLIPNQNQWPYCEGTHRAEINLFSLIQLFHWRIQWPSHVCGTKSSDRLSIDFIPATPPLPISIRFYTPPNKCYEAGLDLGGSWDGSITPPQISVIPPWTNYISIGKLGSQDGSQHSVLALSAALHCVFLWCGGRLGCLTSIIAMALVTSPPAP